MHAKKGYKPAQTTPSPLWSCKYTLLFAHNAHPFEWWTVALFLATALLKKLSSLFTHYTDRVVPNMPVGWGAWNPDLVHTHKKKHGKRERKVVIFPSGLTGALELNKFCAEKQQLQSNSQNYNELSSNMIATAIIMVMIVIAAAALGVTVLNNRERERKHHPNHQLSELTASVTVDICIGFCERKRI